MDPKLRALGDATYRGVSNTILEEQKIYGFGPDALGVAATAALKSSILHLYVAIQVSMPSLNISPSDCIQAWLAANEQFLQDLPTQYANAVEAMRKMESMPQ